MENDKLICLVKDSYVECSGLYDTEDNQERCFSVDSSKLNNILNKLSSNNKYSFSISDDYFYIQCLENKKRDLKRSLLKVKILDDEHAHITKRHINSTCAPITISINELIWSLHRLGDVFETVSLNFDKDKVTISGESDDLSGSSVIHVENGIIEPNTVCMNTKVLINRLWLLGFASCYIQCFLDPCSLKLNVVTKSPDCVISTEF
jgi:hypothetical protein